MKIGTFAEYKGYIGSIEYSIRHRNFHGRLINTKDFVSYESDTIENLFDKFHRAVDNCLSKKLENSML